MKNILNVCTIMFIMSFYALDAMSGETYIAPEPVSRTKNYITICVHPQVELISIVQAISNYPSILGFLMSDHPSEYKVAVDSYYLGYKEHPVVRMFDRLSSQPRMLNFSAPSNIMLYTDSNLRLREDVVLDNFVLDRAGGRDSLVAFLDLLRDFATLSSFNEFFQEHKDYYLAIINSAADNLGDRNYISELETFYGKKQKSYNIILVSLYKAVGFGNSLLHADNTYDLYNTMGPLRVENNVPFFGDENYLKYMIRHEFSHPFVNPMTERYWDYIKTYSSNYDSIPEIARKQVCGDWQECINEFVIRSITTHVAYNETEEAGRWAYEKEKSKGVSCLDILLNKINHYDENRETYPTFESYYLKILDIFKDEIVH
jgi:hypothetical protein